MGLDILEPDQVKYGNHKVLSARTIRNSCIQEISFDIGTWGTCMVDVPSHIVEPKHYDHVVFLPFKPQLIKIFVLLNSLGILRLVVPTLERRLKTLPETSKRVFKASLIHSIFSKPPLRIF
jgi:hypothetical protein